MLLKIYQVGEPVLRQKARKLSAQELDSKDIQQLIDSMIDTLRDVPGVGLAAPQVGYSKQIFIVEDKAMYHKQLSKSVLHEQGRKPVLLKVLINPQLEILEHDTDTYFEGCLSIDGYAGVVSRAKKVKITGLDRAGRPVSHIASGWFARILQHEMEHLTGKLYVDHMQAQSLISTKNFIKLWRDASQAEIRAKFT